MDDKDYIKYKDYPEGSGGKQIYDSYFLPYNEYLKKYYSNPQFEEWNRWCLRYVEPAYDRCRHEDMIKNFGYVSINNYRFDVQYDTYEQLKNDDRLSDEIRKFIGFLAGAGFFIENNITVEHWFDMKNWYNPNVEMNEGKAINEILNYSYGINYIKILLTQMPFWKR